MQVTPPMTMAKFLLLTVLPRCRDIYQTIKYNITTVRYSNTLTLPNNGHDLEATILSGLEYKNYSSFGNLDKGCCGHHLT